MQTERVTSGPAALQPSKESQPELAHNYPHSAHNEPMTGPAKTRVAQSITDGTGEAEGSSGGGSLSLQLLAQKCAKVSQIPA
jgi:hypothetical protein